MIVEVLVLLQFQLISCSQIESYDFPPVQDSLNLTVAESTTITFPYLDQLLMEQHNYSSWDMQLNLPSMSGIGVFSWFCPDTLCAQSAQWLPLRTPATISYAWIAMGALRWTPVKGIFGLTYQITATLDAALAATSSNLIVTRSIRLQTARNSVASVLPSDPYTGRDECVKKTHPLLFTATGTEVLKYPFAAFIADSPIRPFCASNTNFGDFEVYSLDGSNPEVTISGYADFSTLAIPSGFHPVSFTGSKSKSGSVSRMIEIINNVPIEIITPPFQLNSTTGYAIEEIIFAVMMQRADGRAYMFLSDSWNQTSLRITATTMESGYYIFGRFNHTENKVIPCVFSQNVMYKSNWIKRKFSYPDGLIISVSGQSDFQFTAGDALLTVTTPSTMQLLKAYSVGFGSNTGIKMNITSSLKDSSTVWGQYVTLNSAAGGNWVVVKQYIPGDLEIVNLGVYGVLRLTGAPLISKGQKLDAYFGILTLLLLLL